jgi:hypothetical protein
VEQLQIDPLGGIIVNSELEKLFRIPAPQIFNYYCGFPFQKIRKWSKITFSGY